MGDTWITDLTHFLDETGRIAPMPGPARLLAEHFTAIVLMVSHPEIAIPPEYQVRCRRRPGRKPCPGYIEADIDVETNEIIWWCPICDDNGYIRNWKGTMWHLGNDDDTQ
jgi:hypothetical protein